MSHPTLPPLKRTQMVFRLLKRKAFGDHLEDVEGLDSNIMTFVNPRMPCICTITHVIYTMSLKSPLAISYGDSWNRSAKADLDSKMDRSKEGHKVCMHHNFSSSSAASTSISDKAIREFSNDRAKTGLTTPHGILH